MSFNLPFFFFYQHATAVLHQNCAKIMKLITKARVSSENGFCAIGGLYIYLATLYSCGKIPSMESPQRMQSCCAIPPDARINCDGSK